MKTTELTTQNVIIAQRDKRLITSFMALCNRLEWKYDIVDKPNYKKFIITLSKSDIHFFDKMISSDFLDE